MRVVAGHVATGDAGTGEDGAGVRADGAVVAGFGAWVLGEVDAPGGVVEPHPAARPTTAASTARPRSDRMLLTPSLLMILYFFLSREATPPE